MESTLRKAIETLRSGGVAAYPTDTVYGLGSNGLDPQAVLRVFEVKQRPLAMAVPLLAADFEMLRSAVRELPAAAVALAEAFLPGPLTMVLLRAPHIPDVVTAGGDSVAIRIPDHPAPRTLAMRLGAPIVGTSANRSGLPSPMTAAGVREQLGGSVGVIVKGVCTGGVESTVVELTGARPRVLRQGAVSWEAIEAVLGLQAAGSRDYGGIPGRVAP